MVLKYFSRKRFCIGVFLILLLATLNALASETNQLAPFQAVKIGRVLESCPAWSDPKADPNKILEVLLPLAKAQTLSLRRGIEEFVNDCRSKGAYNVGNMSKLFLLNRIVFAVPPKEKFAGPFFGGWEGVPFNEHEIDRLWPLSLSKNGRVNISGKYSGYSGSRYLAVEEFDYFLTKYGRRSVPSEPPGDKPVR